MGSLGDQQAKGAADASSQNIEQAISTHLGESVVFVNDIEEELGFTTGGKNKPYATLQYINDHTFVMPQALKDKITTIYSGVVGK